MLSRAQRRYRDQHKKQPASEAMQEKKRANPWLYGGSVVILIIIVVTFVGTPTVRSAAGGRGGVVFGKYAGREITYTQGGYFAQQRELLGERAQAAGEAVDNINVVYQIWREAFVQTVRHMAILEDARLSRLYVSDDAVDQALIHYGPYLENGEFSEARYRRASAQQKYATRQLYREQLTQDQFLQDTISGVVSSKTEAQKLAAMAGTERSFRYVAFPFTSYPREKIVEYGTANAAKFARIKISRILLTGGKSEAESIKSRLDADPLRFEEIAKASSKDSYAAGGGAMGWQYRYDLELDFETPGPVDTIFALAPGQISPALEGKYGWMIFRCEEAALPIDLTLEEDRQTISTYLDRYEAGLVQDYFLEQAKSFVSRARTAGFDQTAVADSRIVGTTTSFPMNYQGVFFLKPVSAEGETSATEASPFADALYSEEFFRQAFGIREGEVSEPVVMQNAVVVLTLRAETGASQDDLAFMDDYYTYLRQQNLAADLEEALLDETRFVDNFDKVFSEYLMPTGS